MKFKFVSQCSLVMFVAGIFWSGTLNNVSTFVSQCSLVMFVAGSVHILEWDAKQCEQLKGRVPLQEGACCHKTAVAVVPAALVAVYVHSLQHLLSLNTSQKVWKTPDIEEHLVCKPPLPLVAAYCSMLNRKEGQRLNRKEGHTLLQLSRNLKQDL